MEFVFKPIDTTAKLNENLVKFDCIVNSRRAPLDQLEINWYKDNILIDFIKTKYHLSARSLEIISVTDQDQGIYSCSVKYNNQLTTTNNNNNNGAYSFNNHLDEGNNNYNVILDIFLLFLVRDAFKFRKFCKFFK